MPRILRRIDRVVNRYACSTQPCLDSFTQTVGVCPAKRLRAQYVSSEFVVPLTLCAPEIRTARNAPAAIDRHHTAQLALCRLAFAVTFQHGALDCGCCTIWNLSRAIHSRDFPLHVCQ